MKIGRLDNLTRQDNLFEDGEPDYRYEKRQLIIVEDDYNFISNNCTDITSLDNLHLVYKQSLIDYPTYKEWLKEYNIYDVDTVSDNIKGVTIDDSNLINQGIMCFNSTSGVLEYVKFNPMLNVVNINSLQDFIDVSVSYSNNNITLPSNVYNIGSDINLLDNYLSFESDATVSFISNSAKNTHLYSETEGTLFYLTNIEFSIRFLKISCPNGKLFNGSNPNKNKEIIIDSSFVGDTNRLGILSGYKDIHISDTHFYNFDDGFYFNDNITHIHLTTSYINQSTNNSTSGSTFLEFNSSTSGLLDVTNCNFNSNNSEDVVIDVSSGSVFDMSAIIQRNHFSNYISKPLQGANANTHDWHIASRTNVGIPGLYTENIPICVGSYFTTSSSFGQVTETHTIKSAGYYEPDATIIKGKISVTISHGANNGQSEIDLYNISDGVSVTNSLISATIITKDVYQIEESVEFDITENKEYRVRIRRLTGTGQNTAKIRSATLEIKVY